MSEFNIGDKVRITKQLMNIPTARWDLIGKEFIILDKKQDINSSRYRYNFEIDQAYFWGYGESLELVNHAISISDGAELVENDNGSFYIRSKVSMDKAARATTYDVGNYTYSNLKIKNKKKNYIKLNINF